jgi:opacity protein-like surface antigen
MPVEKRSFSLLVVSMLAVLVAAGSARAQQDEFNRPGWSVGAGASGLISGFQGALGRLDYGNTAGFNVHGGYRFNEFLALDGVYEYGDSFGRSSKVFGKVISGSSSINTNAVTVGPKLILPLGRFQPYLDGGVGFVEASGNVRVTDNVTGVTRSGGANGAGFAGRFGGGIDLYLTENWSIYGDNAYTITATGPSNVYYYSFGVGGRYSF